jgi:hypothetical protein
MAILFKRSNGFYYQIDDSNGRKIWRSTGTRSKAEALKIVARFTTPEVPQPIRKLSLTQFESQF